MNSSNAATAAGVRPPSSASSGAWPVLPRSRTGGPRSRVARTLFTSMASRLPIIVELPSGMAIGGGGSRAPRMRLRDPDRFYARVGTGTAGFAESYMAGEWDCDELPALFAVLAKHLPELVPAPLRAFRRLYIPRRPRSESESIAGARRNIERHYDLSNDFFALFLDPTMTYSSALYAVADEYRAGAGGGDTLEVAQQRKVDRLLDITGTGPGTRLLEIGTGWGELALRAAARGADVTSLTISPAQLSFARRRAAAAGLADRIDFQLRDYREARGEYDAIISVEMIEAVGARYWPVYFRTIDRLLAPGGRAGIQAITMPHDRMRATAGGQSWIHQYIFPGGQIPSVRAVHETLAACTGLRVTSDLAMGADYARTLATWRARFAAAEDEVVRLGFSAAFRRMWDLYLAYSEAGFRAGYLDVHQFLVQRPA